MTARTPTDNLLKQHEEEFLLQRDRLLNLIQHYPTIGQHREELIRAFLEKHLPQRFAVGTGFIYSSDRNSRQCDILIYDHINYPPLFREGSLVVIAPAAAIAVIEVKSKLSRSTLTDAFDNIASAKGLSNSALGFVFSYCGCGPKTLEGLLGSKIANGHGGNLPDGIYAMPSVVLRRYEANINCYELSPDESCFRHFYADLLSSLPSSPGVDQGLIKREKILHDKLSFTLTY